MHYSDLKCSLRSSAACIQTGTRPLQVSFLNLWICRISFHRRSDTTIDKLLSNLMWPHSWKKWHHLSDLVGYELLIRRFCLTSNSLDDIAMKGRCSYYITFQKLDISWAKHKGNRSREGVFLRDKTRADFHKLLPRFSRLTQHLYWKFFR